MIYDVHAPPTQVLPPFTLWVFHHLPPITTRVVMPPLPPITLRWLCPLPLSPLASTQYFFGGSCAATLHTACPLAVHKIGEMAPTERIDCVAFPDDGACKRFAKFFQVMIPPSSSLRVSRTGGVVTRPAHLTVVYPPSTRSSTLP